MFLGALCFTADGSSRSFISLWSLEGKPPFHALFTAVKPGYAALMPSREKKNTVLHFGWRLQGLSSGHTHPHSGGLIIQPAEDGGGSGKCFIRTSAPSQRVSLCGGFGPSGKQLARWPTLADELQIFTTYFNLAAAEEGLCDTGSQ